MFYEPEYPKKPFAHDGEVHDINRQYITRKVLKSKDFRTFLVQIGAGSDLLIGKVVLFQISPQSGTLTVICSSLDRLAARE